MRKEAKERLEGCAALACALLPAFFYLRTENSLVAPAETQGASTVFAVALLATLALAGGMLALRPRAVESLFRRTATPFVAAALLACGAAALACLDPPSPDAFTLPALTLAGAVLVAAGTAALVALALERLRHDGFVPLLATVAAALLGASLLWYVLNSFRITMLGAAAVVAAAFAAAVLLRLPHQCGGEPAAAKTPPAVADARTALGRYWGTLFGLAFNFFTMGLTFWPSTAGVSSNESVLVKPGAYAMVLAVVVVAHLAHRRFGSPHENESSGDQLVLVMLPVATAIVLVSPFIDSTLAGVPFIVVNLLPYAGIAALNVLGLAAAVRMAQVTARPVFSVLGWTVLACTASMGVGMALFQLLGQGAQMVSLCVLTLYLVAMLIASIRQTYHLQAERQTAQFGVERACGRIAERYALSPRETEILAFLAHGRGAPYVGEKLCISPETVRTHTKRIYDKCGVHTKEELLDLVEALS